MRKRYTLYTNHPTYKQTAGDNILSSNNLEELVNIWHHRNCDEEEFHRLQPNTITTRTDYGIVCNIDSF